MNSVILMSRGLRAIPVALLLTALLLPYSAPGVCSMLDRMGNDSEMMADIADGAIHARGSGDMCCSTTGCNVFSVAQVAFALDEPVQIPAVRLYVVPFLQGPPWALSPPLTPPPQV